MKTYVKCANSLFESVNKEGQLESVNKEGQFRGRRQS